MGRTETDVVEIVCSGLEWNWQNADRFNLWDGIRGNMQGAMLAMIGSGFKDAQDDFAFLRDLAATRDQMRRTENAAQ
jgi:hypothetical protein